MDDKSRLFKDLAEKLGRLKWTLEQPELFIAEHFAAIRNKINLDTERLIFKFGKENSKDTAKKIEAANSKRTRFLEFLDKNEAHTFANLKEASAGSTPRSFSDLEKRVEEFFSSIEFKDLIEMEEVYLQLALDIIEATNEIERRLLDNQTFAYVPWNKKDRDIKIGNLIYLGEDYLNRNELSCLKPTEDLYLDIIHERIQESLNASLAVGLSRPFIITRKSLIMMNILFHFNSYRQSGTVVCLEGSSRAKLDRSFDDGKFYENLEIDIRSVLRGVSMSSVDAVLLQDISSGFLDSKQFFWSIFQIRVRRIQMADSLIESMTELKIHDNQLVRLDEEQIAKATNLQELELVHACLPDTRFSLGFLYSLTKLTKLDLTLSNVPIDFDVFKCLTNLEYLGLGSAKRIDTNAQRPQLTKKHFKQLSVMKSLSSLRLIGFEIVSLQKDMISEFAKLSSLDLIDNEIAHIEDGVFAKCLGTESPCNHSRELVHDSIRSSSTRATDCLSSIKELDLSGNRIKQLEIPEIFVGLESLENLYLNKNSIHSIGAQMFRSFSRCKILNLSHNRIEQLSPGVFAGLVSLRELILEHNSLQKITRDVFNNLPGLEELNLGNNLIESIEAGSFEGLSSIRTLSLMNNKLKSIDNQMFNRISESKTHDEEKESLLWSSLTELSLNGNQIEKFDSNCFSNFIVLEELDLSNNQLKKVDLNCFNNLKKLEQLNLSNNHISELNETIQPGVLSSLFKLDLSKNRLTRISRHAFSELTGLESINISENKLEAIHKNFFKPFKSLKSLQLQDNNLSMDVTVKTFSSCKRIEEISLLGNPNVRIREGALSKQVQLRVVLLELRCEDAQSIKRFLEHQDNRSFFSSLRLEYLAIVNSSIENFDAFKFDKRFRYLMGLDLSRNKITSMNRECFSVMHSLKALSIAGNLIETLEDPSLFNDLPYLEDLDMSGNKLRHIHRQLFKGLNKLKKLNISNNPTLLNFDAGIFRGLFNLKDLNLAGNNVTYIDLGALFFSCRVLECLDLSNNQLDHESINEASMSGSTAQNLEQLMLANNRLERMDFVRHLYRLEKLDLSGNKITQATLSHAASLLGRILGLTEVNLSEKQKSAVAANENVRVENDVAVSAPPFEDEDDEESAEESDDESVNYSDDYSDGESDNSNDE